MAFTAKYSDLATLVQSSVFQSRVTGAVANYAKYLLGNAGSTLDQINWAKQAVYNPGASASQLYWQAALDPAFSSESASPIDPSAANVSDAALDTVVQTAINNSLLKF